MQAERSEYVQQLRVAIGVLQETAERSDPLTPERRTLEAAATHLRRELDAYVGVVNSLTAHMVGLSRRVGDSIIG